MVEGALVFFYGRVHGQQLVHHPAEFGCDLGGRAHVVAPGQGFQSGLAFLPLSRGEQLDYLLEVASASLPLGDLVSLVVESVDEGVEVLQVGPVLLAVVPVGHDDLQAYLLAEQSVCHFEVVGQDVALDGLSQGAPSLVVDSLGQVGHLGGQS